MRPLPHGVCVCLLAACASAPPGENTGDTAAASPVIAAALVEPRAPRPQVAALPSPLASSLGRQVTAEQILDLPGEYYAVQLVAFRDKRDILDFIARHRLGDPPYGRVLRQGEVWYVLVYGVWPSKAEAEAAVAAMPPVLRSVAPWVRKLGDLQAAIRALM